MREFVHNSERVIYQELEDESFLNLLSENGIIPEELPEENLRYRVFKYYKDGVKRYACVLVANAPDAYIEKVYTTFSYPEDGFWNMMLDITGQIDGEEPEVMRTRLSIAIENAENCAKEWIKKKYPEKEMEWMLLGYPEDIQKEYNNILKTALSGYGYYKGMLDKISAPGVDIEYIKNIFNK